MFPISTPGAPTTLNAISSQPTDLTQAQQRAENLAACLEMRDLGLQLARAAAAEALAIRAQTARERAAAEQTDAPEYTPTPESPAIPKANDPDLAFARHSRSVRQSVELWEKIVHNAFGRHPQLRPARPGTPDFEPDPEDDYLYRACEPPLFSDLDAGNLYEAVGNLSLIAPNIAVDPQALSEIIEETLIAHPDDHLSDNFARVCKSFGITPDRTRLLPHLESQLRPPTNRAPTNHEPTNLEPQTWPPVKPP